VLPTQLDAIEVRLEKDLFIDNQLSLGDNFRLKRVRMTSLGPTLSRFSVPGKQMGAHRHIEAMFRERECFIVNLLVRIHFIIVMIRWTGLAPWEFEILEVRRNPEFLILNP